MNINQLKGGRATITSSGSRKHNLRHTNPTLNKVLLQTRREAMKIRTNSFLPIAKSQIMMSIIAELKESMS